VTFTPVITSGGNAGWAFLQRTREAQQAAFDNSGLVKRDTEYFEQNIGKVTSPEHLMKDYRLLKVALGAFGLDEDINSKFFVRKVLEEGTLAEDAFANKLSDKRYKAMAQAFGFELQPPRTQVSDFGAKITDAYKERQFEVAVGEQDQNLRLVMGFERELSNITKGATAETSMWFTIMATQPVRKVFEGAFNLPTALGTLGIDRQLEIFQEKAQAYFGTSNPTDFLDAERQEELTRRFLVQADLNAGASTTSPGSIALTLLQSVPSPYPSLFG
jgi:hypothetical protein